MPIFDYECSACGHAFDALQKAGEGPLRKCPECGKLSLKKLLAAPNFVLKGTGWYQTDFRGKPDGKKPAGKKDQASEGGGGDKSGHSHGDSHGHSHSHGGHTHSHGPGEHKH